MGTLPRSELVEELKGFFGNRDDITDSRYIRWLNLAQTRIARIHGWEELEEESSLSTTANSKTISIPSNTRKVRSVVLIDGTSSKKLTGYLYKEFDKHIPYPEALSTGRPTIYTHWKGQLELWKIPDAVYSVKMRRTFWPTAFTSSSDVASDLDEKDDAIIMLAASWGHLSLRNTEDGTKYWRIYTRLINEAIGEDVERPDVDLFGAAGPSVGAPTDYWKDPFVHSVD